MRSLIVVATVIAAGAVGITVAVLAAGGEGEPTPSERVANLLLDTGSELDLAERDALAVAIDVVESDTYVIMDKTLIRAKLTMTADAIDAVFEQQAPANDGYKRQTEPAEWTERAFGDHLIVKLDPDGSNELKWWTPFDADAIDYVTWHTHFPDEPRKWIFLQVCEADNAMHEVFLRVESD